MLALQIGANLNFFVGSVNSESEIGFVSTTYSGEPQGTVEVCDLGTVGVLSRTSMSALRVLQCAAFNSLQVPTEGSYKNCDNVLAA